MHLTQRFAGVFLLALVGNAAELFNAIRFARRDKMDLAIGITVGASTQVALLVAPILVFAGAFMGQNMNLLFSPYEMWAIIMAVYIARNLIYDGELELARGPRAASRSTSCSGSASSTCRPEAVPLHPVSETKEPEVC